jgi:hypothetical protein
MTLKIEHTSEALTGRSGLILVDEYAKRIGLAATIDRVFGAPGSNRGYRASRHVLSLTDLIIDGATSLDQTRVLGEDDAIRQLRDHPGYPSPDALGDWLRRFGGRSGEARMWMVQKELLKWNGVAGETLDIDGTIQEKASPSLASRPRVMGR